MHYEDKKGEIKRIFSFDWKKEQTEKQVAIPYMKNKPFMVGGVVIHPCNVIQILIFESEKNAENYPLPNGKIVKNEKDVFYIAKSFSSMEGIFAYTDLFITSPPKEEVRLIRTPTVILGKKRKVFIVHGRNETEALRLQKYLTKTLNVDAEMFEDFKERSGSTTIIEQLEYIKDNVGYAFVVVTPDDLGCLRENIDNCKANMLIGKTDVKVETVCEILDNLNTRARQNVVFEHGLFIGALGRDNVCCLLQKDTKEKPSDVDGILYVGFDKSVAEKFSEITEKLKNAGLVKI